MTNTVLKKYTEVKIDGASYEKSYRNPLTKIFQYEYGLYAAMTELFDHVECKSMCIESLRMYFKEMPLRGQDGSSAKNKDPKKNIEMNQEKLLENMRMMVSSDVTGNITFPMMEKCAAEVTTITRKDGTHWFIFTDGIYGFALHLTMEKNKKPVAIEVKELNMF